MNIMQTRKMKKQLMEDAVIDSIEKLVLGRFEDPDRRASVQRSINGARTDLSKRQKLLTLMEKDGTQTVKDARVLGDIKRLMKTFDPYGTGFSLVKDHLAPLVEHLREYVRVGEVEKKEHGEVMTPIWLVEDMLDKLPERVWSDPSLKWLDPCNGCGVFPSVVVSRLMNGLQNAIPDQVERYRHIVESMIHVCDIQAKNCFLHMVAFDPKDLFDMNVYCGSFLDEGFDKFAKEAWGVDKFDIIVGNPPYQEMTDGHGAQARALYNKFSEKAFAISSSTLFVTPSRWFAGGMGLGDFREKMLNSKKIKLIRHFPEDFRRNGEKIFGNNVEIKGGVSYFLQDNNYSGPCVYNGSMVDLSKYDILIQDSRLAGIVDKVKNLPSLAELAKSRSYFGISTNEKALADTQTPADIICYTSKKNGYQKYIAKSRINKKYDYYKVLVTAAAHGGWSGVSNVVVASQDEVCNFAYMHFSVESKAAAESLASFLRTRLANVLVSCRKPTQDLKPSTFNWVPLLPLNRTWDDASVYDYLDLTEKEIALIEKTATEIKGAHNI